MRNQPPYKLKIIVLLSVLMTAILLCSTLAINATLRSSVRRQMEENGANTLAQLRSSTEIILKVMDDSLVQMSLDTDLQSFSDRYDLLDIFDCEELYQRLYQFRAVNRFIDKLYIHYYPSGKVLDLNGKDPRLTDLDALEDQEILQQLTDLTLEERYRYSFTLFNLAEDGEDTRLYMTKSASPIAAKPGAVVVVSLRQSYFQELLQSISLDEVCGLYVTDRDGGYLFGKSGGPAPGDDVLTIENQSEDTGWTYHYDIPEGEINHRVNRVTLVLWAITAAMAVISFLGVCYLAQELYKPVQQLIDDKAAAEQLLEENKPFLREDTFRRLLEPSDTPEEQWRTLLERYGAPCPARGYYAVLVLAFEQFERLSYQIGEAALDERLLYKVQTIRTLSDHMDNGAIELIRDRRKAKFILVVTLEAQSRVKAEKRVDELTRQIFSSMKEGMALPITMGVGHTYEHLTHLCASYEEAVAAYNYRSVVGDDQILYVKYLPDVQEQGFIFPNKLAQAVFAAVKQGERPELEDRLEQFFHYVKENLRPSTPPSYVAVQFFNSTLQFLQELSIDARAIFADPAAESANILEIETLSVLEAYFRALAAKLQDYLLSQRATPSNRVSDQIRAYLDQNYATDVTLNTLAEEFHFSVSHLAREFKNDTGKSIKEYITEKRIEAAKVLLADKNAKVGEVACQVGYSSPRSFINIFKKYTGSTPGEYKEQL